MVYGRFWSGVGEGGSLGDTCEICGCVRVEIVCCFDMVLLLNWKEQQLIKAIVAAYKRWDGQMVHQSTKRKRK